MEAGATAKLTTPRRNWEAWALAALLLAHVLLGVYWSAAIPIWESYDEIGHYYFVRYLATQHSLPDPNQRLVEENDESHQPPLYYLLAAIPVSFVDVDDGVEPKANPYMWWGPEAGGWNRVVHDATEEGWPYHGTVLAVHLARWVSVLLGALVLFATFQAARLLAPTRPWVRWGATLIVAFWPHFRFSTAVIGNDIMVTATAAVVTWLLVWLAVAERPRATHVLALLGATGLALLSKNNGVALVPVVVLVLVGRVLAAKGALRRRLVLGLLGGAVAAVAAVGWWYARNAGSGAGVFGRYRSLKTVGKILAPLVGGGSLHLDLLLPALREGLWSLWANLGWGNVRLPAPTYWAAAACCGLALAGLLLWLMRRPARRDLAAAASLLLVVASTVCAVLLFRLNKENAGIEGRYLLPILPALSALLALGWSNLVPVRLKTASWALLAGAMGGLALLTPALYIRPAYAPPPQLSEVQAASYTTVQARMGEFAELVGYRIEDRFVDPGGKLHLTLVWRTLAQADAEYTLAVQVFGAHRRLVGEVQRFPGHGTLSTDTWAPGYLFSEEVLVPIRSDEEQAQLASVEVSFFQRDGVRAVAVYGPDGREVGNSLRLAPVKVRGTVRAAPAEAPTGLQFGPGIRLVGGQAALQQESGEWRLSLTLNWAAVGRPDKDYTVSIQLRDAQNAVGPQVDSQPQEGAYPTSFWEAGETIEDGYALTLPADLPAGTYTLYACLYDLATLERLPVADLNGQPLANSEVPLLRVLVRPGQPPVLEAQSPVIEMGG